MHAAMRLCDPRAPLKDQRLGSMQRRKIGSPSGILVNGRLVMESAALGDVADLKVGIFRMRIVKETPAPRVEF